MAVSAVLSVTSKEEDAWRNFKPGDWCTSIAVRDFIVRNATTYSGDEKFLAAPSTRTKAVWAKLQPYFQEERKKGVLAADAKNPSTMLAHNPGYIDQNNEIVVGSTVQAGDIPVWRASHGRGRAESGRDRSRSTGP
jgi:formate C-acetyltransferase